ncbi:hypothetical protein Mapa_012750 [Marchantia paleacea]|nr:hypothetical protein Mapa_012750 [Marchantia paleacea]
MSALFPGPDTRAEARIDTLRKPPSSPSSSPLIPSLPLLFPFLTPHSPVPPPPQSRPSLTTFPSSSPYHLISSHTTRPSRPALLQRERPSPGAT